MALFSIFEDSDPLTMLLIHNPMYLKQKCLRPHGDNCETHAKTLLGSEIRKPLR